MKLTGKTIGIQGHADPLLTEKPVMIFFSLDISGFKLLTAIHILTRHNLNQT